MNLKEVIKQNIDETIFDKKIENLLVELDKTIRFFKIVDYRILKITPINEKNEILELRQKKYMKFFNHNELIMESYFQHFGKNIILEGERNYKKEIFEFYDFLKYSILLESGLLNEGTWNPFNRDFWSVKNAKEIGGQALNVAKTAVEYSPVGLLYKGGKWVYEKASQAIDYIKKNGVAFIFEKIRNLLMNGFYNALEIVLGIFLPGWGQILTTIPWIVMTCYDGYQIFINNLTGSWMNFVIDIVMMLLNLIGAKAGFASSVKKAASEGATVIAKEAGKPGFFSKILKFLIEKVPGLKSIVGALNKFMGWFLGLINKVLDFFATIGCDWIKKAISPITKSIEKMIAEGISSQSVLAQVVPDSWVGKGVNYLTRKWPVYLRYVSQKMGKDQILKQLGGGFLNRLKDKAFQKYLIDLGRKELVSGVYDATFKKLEKFVINNAYLAIEDLVQEAEKLFGNNTYVHDTLAYILVYSKMIRSVDDYKKTRTGLKGPLNQLDKVGGNTDDLVSDLRLAGKKTTEGPGQFYHKGDIYGWNPYKDAKSYVKNTPTNKIMNDLGTLGTGGFPNLVTGRSSNPLGF